MRLRFCYSFLPVLLCLGFLNPAVAQTKPSDSPPVSFTSQVKPILKRRCEACHHPAFLGGKLDLSSYEAFKTGGRQGTGFVAARPENSLVMRYISGATPLMPKGSLPLKSEEVELIRKWIAEGAKNDTPSPKSDGKATANLPADAKASPDVVKTPVDVAGIEFFEKRVRPVLAQQCYACHSTSAKKTMGGLALDSRSGLLKGGQTGPALVPGHPESSRLLDAVRYTKPELQMPPKTKLPDSVIADLTEWVKRGAPWPEDDKEKRRRGDKEQGSGSANVMEMRRRHWAFQPVRKSPLPLVKAKTGVINPIDRFILAKLEAKGLKPAPPADRRTLIRRAYFDLIGLPPSPDEVNAFLADKSPDAWAKVIDGLLASPHYGERWGRYWLDIARYGEDQAHSFEPRLYPQGFRYRDWLAHALNSDMPYDRFVKEQIAADLLNEPDLREQLPALGFFALGPVYYGDEKMYDQYDDRIDTLSRGFLGLTVACARCHDHKFDPITQKDYYALAGVFASTAYIEVPLGSTDAQAKFGKAEANVNHRSRIDAQNQQIEKWLTEQETASRTRLLSDTARYMVAVWKLNNRRKINPKVSVEQVATSENLYGVVLERWLKYLKETQESGNNRPQLADWKRMVQQEDAKADLSTNEAALTEAKKTAIAFQEVVLALQKRREDSRPPKTPVVVTVAAGTGKAAAARQSGNGYAERARQQ